MAAALHGGEKARWHPPSLEKSHAFAANSPFNSDLIRIFSYDGVVVFPTSELNLVCNIFEMMEMNLSELDATSLASCAAEWRRRALHGEHAARGIAHTLERELRQRVGDRGVAQNRDLDMRPLALRLPKVRWWKLW